MGNRTIVEINHDMGARVMRYNTALPELLDRALATNADEDWKALEFFGIKKVTTAHSSEERKLYVGRPSRKYVFG